MLHLSQDERQLLRLFFMGNRMLNRVGFFRFLLILKFIFSTSALPTHARIPHRFPPCTYTHSGNDLPARHSIAFFCNPNKATTVQALPGTGAPKHAPINAFDYLIGRLNATI